MAVQKVNVTPSQPYDNPAYTKPRAAVDNRRQAGRATRAVDRRNASTVYPQDRTRNAQTDSRYQSIDRRFNDQYARQGLQPSDTPDKRTDRTQKANAQYAQTQRPNYRPSRLPKIKRRQKTKAERATAYLAARARVTVANAWIGGWAAFWYVTFQIPLAVISAASLGMAFTITSFMSQITSTPVIGGLIAYTVNNITIKAANVVEAAAKFLFGVTFDPIQLFITPFALVFLLGLIQLILTWFVYSCFRIRSLSGRAAGVKGVLFVITGVGYAIPILNLFPLIFLWMAVVWLYPK